MQLIKLVTFTILCALLLPSCAKIFYSPDAYTLARKEKTIAIMPPSVSIAASKKIDGEALKEQQKTESINFQKEMYSWMLKRKMQGMVTQEIQDIETTNAKLKKSNYPEIPLTKDEICEVLGVDGIMSSNFGLSKPMSQGSAIVIAVVFGAYGATNEVHVNYSINDCPANKLIWNYDHKFSGSMGSTPARLVDASMRAASKKMPYIKQN